MSEGGEFSKLDPNELAQFQVLNADVSSSDLLTPEEQLTLGVPPDEVDNGQSGYGASPRRTREISQE